MTEKQLHSTKGNRSGMELCARDHDDAPISTARIKCHMLSSLLQEGQRPMTDCNSKRSPVIVPLGPMLLSLAMLFAYGSVSAMDAPEPAEVREAVEPVPFTRLPDSSSPDFDMLNAVRMQDGTVRVDYVARLPATDRMAVLLLEIYPKQQSYRALLIEGQEAGSVWRAERGEGCENPSSPSTQDPANPSIDYDASLEQSLLAVDLLGTRLVGVLGDIEWAWVGDGADLVSNNSWCTGANPSPYGTHWRVKCNNEPATAVVDPQGNPVLRWTLSSDSRNEDWLDPLLETRVRFDVITRILPDKLSISTAVQSMGELGGDLALVYHGIHRLKPRHAGTEHVVDNRSAQAAAR